MAKTETLERLAERRREASERAEDLDHRIAVAISAGAAAAVLAPLRQERRELVDEADDIGEAMRVLSDARDAEAERDAARALAKARADAAGAGAALLDAAAAVDAAIENLEASFERLRLRGLDLSRALRLAGAADDGRLARGIGPALRWAAWRGAPGFSEHAQVPRVEAQRRRTMRESAARLIPNAGAGR